MDMFDAVKAGLGGLRGTGSGSNDALGAVLSLLNGQGGEGGGLDGIVKLFQSQGLGDVVASWIGTGQNLPVSADQIHKALGSQQLSQFASQAGLAPDAAGSTLASLLPTIIDRLTPNGQLPSAGQQLPGLDVLSQLLK
jgi:uncharacterized protein YidB (DUF937 family)